MFAWTFGVLAGGSTEVNAGLRAFGRSFPPRSPGSVRGPARWLGRGWRLAGRCGRCGGGSARVSAGLCEELVVPWPCAPLAFSRVGVGRMPVSVGQVGDASVGWGDPRRRRGAGNANRDRFGICFSQSAGNRPKQRCQHGRGGRSGLLSLRERSSRLCRAAPSGGLAREADAGTGAGRSGSGCGVVALGRRRSDAFVGVGVRPDAALDSPMERVDRGALLGGELEVEDVEVFRHSLRFG